MIAPLLTLGMHVNVFERGTAGIPTTTPIAALEGRIESYEQTIDHHIGFESMRCSFIANAEEGLDWLTNGLMRSCEVTGPDAEIVWEGFLETIEVQFGQETRSVSLREMANRIRVRYQTVLGTPGARPTSSAFFQDTDSIALYGYKDLVLSLGNTSDGTEVDDYGNTMLSKLSNPQSAPTSTIASGELGEIRITLNFAGWYTTLEWVLAANSSTTKTTTTTQIGTLLTALAAINAFVSTATTNITASGVTATEFIDADTPYRDKVEALMARGNGTQPYTWGVYENREFYGAIWAGATPDTFTYQRYLGVAAVFDSAGAEVAFWNVRPNAMYQVVELLDVVPVGTQQDAAARFYVARVTCVVSRDTISMNLEPEQSANLESVLITKYL